MWNYETTLRWTQGPLGQAGSAGKPELTVSPPPEFGGEAGRWTPEDLLVSAIETCLMMTTLNVAQRQKIEVRGYTSKASGQLEKTPEGLRFTAVLLTIELQVADEASREKAVKAVQIAEKYCPVSNAVKFPVHVTVNATAS